MASNIELKASTRNLIKELAEVKTQLAETKDQLADMISRSGTGSGVATDGSLVQSYASALTRSMDPSSSASQPAAGTTASNITDTLYCTIDTSRVEDRDKNKAQPGAIRQAIEEEIRTTDVGTN